MSIPFLHHCTAPISISMKITKHGRKPWSLPPWQSLRRRRGTVMQRTSRRMRAFDLVSESVSRTREQPTGNISTRSIEAVTLRTSQTIRRSGRQLRFQHRPGPVVESENNGFGEQYRDNDLSLLRRIVMRRQHISRIGIVIGPMDRGQFPRVVAFHLAHLDLTEKVVLSKRRTVQCPNVGIQIVEHARNRRPFLNIGDDAPVLVLRIGGPTIDHSFGKRCIIVRAVIKDFEPLVFFHRFPFPHGTVRGSIAASSKVALGTLAQRVVQLPYESQCLGDG
mmetsp:Transcript_27379/g.57827  ORF Transcript_27379/g.57827 Transcript_27379/m.57827 type:complete len:278 (+) Transcript_27379:77-910(+)